MAQSKITSKNQTTVPREVRERLGVGPADVLLWEVVDAGEARLTVADRKLLHRRGSIAVGAGSPVDDVREARRRRGGGAR
jgi:bifunctional DNA-binding transcriptional regulator/antitoxin component of YhaV-PrlF toxin-antitoxin module